MKLWLSTVGARSTSGAASQLREAYLAAASRYVPCRLHAAPTEAKFLAWIDKAAARTRPFAVLAHSAGQQLTSAEFATTLARQQDAGTQMFVLAIGPADGWSPAALARADRTFSFGRITLPHDLAAAVAAEQLYRALTILACHPYHTGH